MKRNHHKAVMPPALDDCLVSERVLVRLHPSLLRQIKQIAKKKGMKQTSVLEALVQMGITQLEESEKLSLIA